MLHGSPLLPVYAIKRLSRGMPQVLSCYSRSSNPVDTKILFACQSSNDNDQVQPQSQITDNQLHQLEEKNKVKWKITFYCDLIGFTQAKASAKNLYFMTF